MIRTLFTATAVATLLATGAFAAENMAQPATPAAQPANPPGMKSANEVKANEADQMDGHLASNIIGQSVYNGAGTDGKNIGDVNDLVIGKDGKVASVVVGVGGFLGIGEKNVAIDYKQVSWQQRDGSWWIIVPTTADELKALPNFDRRAFEPAPSVAGASTGASGVSGGMAPAPASGTAANDTATDESSANNGAASTDQQAATTGKSDRTAMSSETGGTNGTDATATDKSTTAAIDRSKLNKVETSTISADDFIGTTVYGADDKKIGEIGDVVLNKDGKIDAVVVDVGGFLGVGEKQVAVGMDNLAFLADESGNKYLYTEFTEDQLKAQPAYDKNSYAQSRDKMRMSVQ